MRDFFKPWRRKAGCVTLVMALSFMGGWIRSFETGEFVAYGYIGCASIDGSFCLTTWSDGDWQSPEYGAATGPENNPASAMSDHFRCLWKFGGFGQYKQHYEKSTDLVTVVPYWAIVFPLTLLSAHLLLRNPRPVKSIKPSEPAPAEAP